MEKSNTIFCKEVEGFNLTLFCEADDEQILLELKYEGKLLYKRTLLGFDNRTSDFIDHYHGNDQIMRIKKIIGDICLLKKKIIDESDIFYEKDKQNIFNFDIYKHTKVLIDFLDEVINIFIEIYKKNQVNLNIPDSDDNILKELVDDDQLELDHGKYYLKKGISLKEFIHFCINSGLMLNKKDKNGKEIVTAEFIYKYINQRNNTKKMNKTSMKYKMETIERYIRLERN